MMKVKWTNDDDAIAELLAMRQSEERQEDEFTVNEYMARYNSEKPDAHINHGQARRQLDKYRTGGALTSRMAYVDGRQCRVYKKAAQ